jgi:short-subunit dehydrogenase
MGFTAVAGFAMRLFMQQGAGHLVGISSVAAYRGGGAAPAYNASKAFVSNYLEGLRHKAFKAGLPVHITDVKPGFVDTAMAKGEKLYWVAPVEKAALQIQAAVDRREPHVIVTRRWRLIAELLRLLPFRLYARLG